jgi:catechol 2,3-dioxygenase-like lactoylglutathione lyase family enzyme
MIPAAMHQYLVPLLLSALGAAPLAAQLPAMPLFLRPEVTVVLRVADLDRSARFYAEVLGTRVDFRDDKAGLALLATPLGNVMLGLSRGEPVRGGPAPTFYVMNHATAQRQLTALKVTPSPVRELAGLWRALTVLDPDGNEIQIAEPLRSRDGGLPMICAGPGPLSKLLFLHGAWRAEHDGTVQEEVWTAATHDTMYGQNRTTRGDDLVDFELLRIVGRGEDVYYEARPRGGKATAFKLVAGDSQSATFANPEHDFPKRIRYWLAEGRLHAAIDDGRDDGRRVEFVWSRVQ